MKEMLLYQKRCEVDRLNENIFLLYILQSVKHLNSTLLILILMLLCFILVRQFWHPITFFQFLQGVVCLNIIVQKVLEMHLFYCSS